MAFVPVPNTLQVDVLYLLDSQRVENTLYFERTSGWTLPEIIDWIEQLRTLISEELMPLLNDSIQFIELVARLLDAASSIGYVASVVPPVNGGKGGNCAPNNVSYTIGFKTGLTGRSFRGRNFVPGISSADIADNTIVSDLRTGLLAFYSLLRTAASESSAPWVVVSRYSGVDPVTKKPIPRVTGVTTPVTSVTTYDNVVDSQRRRLPGRGT
jgi:hypothetical protein